MSAGPAPEPCVSAIVVAHDSAATLARAVASLLASNLTLEVIVVDNGSRDGAPGRLAPSPALVVLRNDDNPGFGAACNQGAARARGRWLAFVNPDCFVAPDTLATLVAALETDPALGLVGADVRDAQGRPEPAARRRDPTPARVLSYGFGRDWHALHLAPGPGALTPVDAVSGALMLLARERFVALGGFDPRYRLHVEDLDLCRRVRLSGAAVAVVEGARAVHLKGTSSRRRPLFVAFHKYRGLWRYWRRWDGAAAAWPKRMLVALALVAGGTLALLGGLIDARRGSAP